MGFDLVCDLRVRWLVSEDYEIREPGTDGSDAGFFDDCLDLRNGKVRDTDMLDLGLSCYHE